MECPNCKSRIVLPPQRPLTVLCAFCGQWSVVFENEVVMKDDNSLDTILKAPQMASGIHEK